MFKIELFKGIENYCRIVPDIITSEFGRDTIGFHVGCDTGVTLGKFDLYFILTDYSLIPMYQLNRPLMFQIKSKNLKKHMISVSAEVKYVAHGGYSLPIVIDLKDARPYNGLTVVAEVMTTPYSGLQMHRTDRLFFDYETYRG